MNNHLRSSGPSGRRAFTFTKFRKKAALEGHIRIGIACNHIPTGSMGYSTDGKDQKECKFLAWKRCISCEQYVLCDCVIEPYGSGFGHDRSVTLVHIPSYATTRSKCKSSRQLNIEEALRQLMETREYNTWFTNYLGEF